MGSGLQARGEARGENRCLLAQAMLSDARQPMKVARGFLAANKAAINSWFVAAEGITCHCPGLDSSVPWPATMMASLLDEGDALVGRSVAAWTKTTERLVTELISYSPEGWQIFRVQARETMVVFPIVSSTLCAHMFVREDRDYLAIHALLCSMRDSILPKPGEHLRPGQGGCAQGAAHEPDIHEHRPGRQSD